MNGQSGSLTVGKDDPRNGTEKILYAEHSFNLFVLKLQPRL